MTRKRFIKLAMSYGIQRNEAEILAQGVDIAGSYQELYKGKVYYFAWAAIGPTFSKAVKSALQIVKKFSANFNICMDKAIKPKEDSGQ